MRGNGSLRRHVAGVALLLLLTVTPSAQTEQPLSVGHSGEVSPGGVLALTIESVEPLESVTAVLLDGTRELSGNYGVSVADSGEGAQKWVALLGVANTIRAGEYQVAVHGAPGNSLYRGKVEVLPRSFVQEDIPLSMTISELRRAEDPKKREQALKMIALTNSFNPDAMFWTGSLSMPVESDRRTSRYGDRRRFIYADGEEARSVHNGVDLAAPRGTPVYAPGAGRVVFAEDRIVTGNSVVIEHYPGVYGLFYHLDRIDVAVGEQVELGTPIGTVGSTGVSTGPHLHWEMRVGGVSVDPGPFIESPLVDTAGGIGAVSE